MYKGLYGWGEGGGEEGPLEGAGPENNINSKHTVQNTEYRIQNTEYRIQNTTAAKLMYIKLPTCLFFFQRRLYLMILMGGKSITHFLGPSGTHFARCHFRAQ